MSAAHRYVSAARLVFRVSGLGFSKAPRLHKGNMLSHVPAAERHVHLVAPGDLAHQHGTGRPIFFVIFIIIIIFAHQRGTGRPIFVFLFNIYYYYYVRSPTWHR